jgi:hypothetical protein
MTAEQRVEIALGSAEPVTALRGLVGDLAREGSSKIQIYRLLEKYLVEIRTRPEFGECREDAMVDVLDALSGWCHPGAELIPEKPAR